MINCFKDPIHGLMNVLLSTNDDDHAKEDDDIVDAKEKEGQIGGNTLTLKSSLRKADLNSTESEKKKKKVQWVDLIGKELAEIREFEPSEEEDDMDSDGCDCVIL